MLNLVTKVAKDLHAEWCRQMWEKGWHWKDSPCRYCPDANPYGTNTIPNPCACSFYSTDLIPWPDLPESRRQEYLATAKAVLPEIVGEVLNEGKIASALYCGVPKNVRHAIEAEGYVQTHWEAAFAKIIVDALRVRRLEELK